MADVFDSDGANITASVALNNDHKAWPSEPEGDGHCRVCGFAAGWLQTTPNVAGHSTTASSHEVSVWIAAQPRDGSGD